MTLLNTPWVLALGILMPIANTFIVGLRIFARHKRSSFGLDDLFAVTGLLISVLCHIVLAIGAARYGFGKHSTNLTAEEGFTDVSELMENTKHMAVILNFMVPLGLGQTKLSVLFLYRRIFRSRVFKILLWCLVAFCVAWTITFFFLSLFQCGHNVALTWTSAQNLALYCLPGVAISLSETSLDFFSDLLILVFPMFWLSKLELHWSRKILVIMVFMFGFLATASSLARLVVFDLQYPAHNANPDQLNYLTFVSYWRCFELGMAVIACCLPTLSGLVSDRTRRRLASWMNSMLPIRYRSTRQYPDSITMKGSTAGDTRRGTVIRHADKSYGGDDDPFRGEPYVAVESFATVGSRRPSATGKTNEKIVVFTETKRVSRSLSESREHSMEEHL